MKKYLFGKLHYHILVCLCTFLFSLTLTYACSMYIHRQAVFNDAAWQFEVNESYVFNRR